MSDLATLMRRIRRRTKDRSLRIFVQDNPLLENAAAMTILASDVRNLPTPGISLNFDDDTDELVVTTEAADSTANTVAIARGQEGTAPADHAQNVAALKSPRFTNAEIIEAISFVVDNELWPHVWIPLETTLTWQGANEYYDAPVPGIEELTYAYQISGGYHYELYAKFLHPGLADEANFPNGAILIPQAVDAGTIYISARVRPTLGTLAAELEHLAIMGGSAELVMTEELGSVGGDEPVTAGRVQPGSRLRAGAVLWERFADSRTAERIRLQHAEQLARRKFFGAGRG